MKFLNSLLTILFVSFFLVSNSQISSSEKKGDTYFNNFSYSKAIKKYLKIGNKNLHVKQNLAESYFKLKDFKNSEIWSKEAVSTSGHEPEDLIKYSYILRVNKKYSFSDEIMNKYYDLAPNDSRALQSKNNKNGYKNLIKNKKQFFIKKLNFNGTGNEFGSSFYKNTLVFLSNNEISVKNKSKKSNSYKLYNGIINRNITISKIKEFTVLDNNIYGSVTFNEIGTYLIYSSIRDSKSSDKIYNLYYSDFINGKWSIGKSLPFNKPIFNFMNPSLSSDGNTLYFMSNMKGGKGGNDLYVSKRTNNFWSTPKNLGSNINTEGNEDFPFISSDGTKLIFSSDGLYGIGGMDLFSSSVSGENFGNPKNFGYPLNSSFDDFGLILDDDFTKGYFSSNRVGGKGDNDIYGVKILKPLCTQLKGKVLSKVSKKSLNGVSVSLFDKDDNILQTLETKHDGSYEFCLDKKDIYVVKASKESYSSTVNFVDLASSDNIESNFLLSKAPDFSIYDIVTDKSNGKKLNDVKCTITSCDNTFKTIISTSINGDFIMPINKSLNQTVCYNILFEKNGYKTLLKKYQFVIDHQGQYNFSEQLIKSASNKNSAIAFRNTKKSKISKSNSSNNKLSFSNQKHNNSIEPKSNKLTVDENIASNVTFKTTPKNKKQLQFSDGSKGSNVNLTSNNYQKSTLDSNNKLNNFTSKNNSIQEKVIDENIASNVAFKTTPKNKKQLQFSDGSKGSNVNLINNNSHKSTLASNNKLNNFTSKNNSISSSNNYVKEKVIDENIASNVTFKTTPKNKKQLQFSDGSKGSNVNLTSNNYQKSTLDSNNKLNNFTSKNNSISSNNSYVKEKVIDENIASNVAFKTTPKNKKQLQFSDSRNTDAVQVYETNDLNNSTISNSKSNYNSENISYSNNNSNSFISSNNIKDKIIDENIASNVAFKTTPKNKKQLQFSNSHSTGGVNVNVGSENNNITSNTHSASNSFANNDKAINVIYNSKSNIVDDDDDVSIENIYFDVDRYDIKQDSKYELDKIISLMTQYPNLTIELSSHTDCRATKKYNQILSQNRARASVRYIQSRISNPSRISGQGFGETRLTNNCVCEPTNNSNCSEYQHQDNRRTEFIIISQ